MYSKQDLLKFAFDEAINSVNINSVNPELVVSIITTGMKAYAETNSMKFTDEEIAKTIEEGLQALKAAGDDFKLQTKMML